MKKLVSVLFMIVILLGIFSLGVFAGNNYAEGKHNDNAYEDNLKIDINEGDGYETNYEGLFKLGLVPSTQSRQLEENDIDTGVKLIDGDKIYSLIESRTWGTGDYGKTFIIRIV